MPRAPLVLLFLALLAAPAAARPGDLDQRFGRGGHVNGPYGTGGDAFVVAPGERLVLLDTRPGRLVVRRYRRSGKPDKAFSGDGVARVPIDGIHYDGWIGAAPDGALTLVTKVSRQTSSGWDVARLRADGSLDTAYGQGGIARVEAPGRSSLGKVAFQPDGGVVVVGTWYDERQEPFAMRVRPDGALDRAFGFWHPGRGDPGQGWAVAVQRDGRILVAGDIGDYGRREPARERVWALTPAGRLDETWGDGGRFTGPAGSSVSEIVAAPDGGVVVLDGIVSVGQAALWLQADGRRRESWGLDGRVLLDHFANSAAFDARGRLLLAGTGSVWNAAVSRIDEHGRLDPAFGRRGMATPPIPRPSTRTSLVGIGVLADESIAAGGYSLTGYPDIREDYGRPRAWIARLRGWDSWLSRGRPSRVMPGRRAVLVRGYSSRGRRVDIRVTQGKRLLARRRVGLSYEGRRIPLRRTVAPRSLVTVTARDRDGQGRPDHLRWRLRAPSR